MAADVERFGALDILVNNAATNPSMGPTIEADLGAWDKTFQVNLRGLFVWTQLAWHARMQEHGGSVINLSSIGGLRGDASIGVYNTTKAAIIHLTKILAVDIGPEVRVNAIAPGLVKTDFAAPCGRSTSDLVGAGCRSSASANPTTSPPPRCSSPSDEARWITGHTLVVDGGALAGASPIITKSE